MPRIVDAEEGKLPASGEQVERAATFVNNGSATNGESEVLA